MHASLTLNQLSYYSPDPHLYSLSLEGGTGCLSPHCRRAPSLLRGSDVPERQSNSVTQVEHGRIRTRVLCCRHQSFQNAFEWDRMTAWCSEVSNSVSPAPMLADFLESLLRLFFFSF